MTTGTVHLAIGKASPGGFRLVVGAYQNYDDAYRAAREWATHPAREQAAKIFGVEVSWTIESYEVRGG
jgi:hypothetical protein